MIICGANIAFGSPEGNSTLFEGWGVLNCRVRGETILSRVLKNSKVSQPFCRLFHDLATTSLLQLSRRAHLSSLF